MPTLQRTITASLSPVLFSLRAQAKGLKAKAPLSPVLFSLSAQLKGLKALALAAAPRAPEPLGLRVDAEKRRISGRVMPEVVEGVPLVFVPGLDAFPAPDPGKVSSYLLESDRLLMLKRRADGSVQVSTRELGLKAGKKGKFSGAVLPDERGIVNLGGREIDVKELKPGKTIKKKIKIDGKKYKVELRMNEDGSVSVKGKRHKGFFAKLGDFFTKVMGVVGKVAPLLAAIPGLGWAALAAKVAGVFNAAKGVVDSIRSGSLLGVVSSAAGLVANFSQGAVRYIAEKVGTAASFVRGVGSAIKNGLGNGFFQVVSNGVNLLSSGAGLLGANALADTTAKVANYAAVADAASRGKLLIAASHLIDIYGPEIAEKLRRRPDAVEYSIHGGFRFNTDPKALLKHLGYNPELYDFRLVTIESPARAAPGTGFSRVGSNKPTPGQTALIYALDSLGLKPVRGQFADQLPSNLVAGPGGFGDGLWGYLGGLAERLRGFGCAVTGNPLNVFGVGAKCGTEAINEALGLEPMPDNDNTRRGEIAGVVATLPLLGKALEQNLVTLASITTPAYAGGSLEVLIGMGRAAGLGNAAGTAALSGGSSKYSVVPGAQRTGGPTGARQPRFSDYCGHCTAVNLDRAAGGTKFTMWDLVKNNPPAADGITVFELRDILRGLGHRRAHAIKAWDIAQWGSAADRTGLPVVVLRDGHYLTVDAVKGGYVYFRDSAAGSFQAPVSSFQGKYPGVLINR